jgi:hypothetical protein
VDESQLSDILQQEANAITPGPFPASAIARDARRARRAAGGLGIGVVGLAVGLAVGGATLLQTPSAEVRDARVQAERPKTESKARPNAQPEPGTLASGSIAAPGPVSATFGSTAALKHYFETIEELATAPEVDAIIIGKISNVSYESEEGLAKTIFTVQVSKALKGQPPSTVVVREDGGFLRASTVMAEIAQKYPELEQKVDPKSYVDVTFEGAMHPRVGDEVLLFLWPDPNPGHEGDFMEIGSVYGRFTRGSDGSFHRAGDVTGMESEVSLSDLNEVLSTR